MKSPTAGQTSASFSAALGRRMPVDDLVLQRGMLRQNDRQQRNREPRPELGGEDA